MTDAAVAVIGGGISGLAAAYELHQQQVPFVLLEKSDRLGGLVRTDCVSGFTIDTGPDSLLIQKPAAVDLCTELGLSNQLVPTLPPRTAYVVRGGTLRPLPRASVFGIPTRVGSLLASRLLSWRGKLRMGFDLVTPRRRELTDESVASFFRRRFGNESVTYLAEPLLAGIHAGDVERLSMHALFPRLVEAEREHGSVIKAFRHISTLNSAEPSAEGVFRSLTGGLGTLATALVDALPISSLHRGSEATGLTGQGPFTITRIGAPPLTVNEVICALPAYAVTQLLCTVSTELSELCGSVPSTSVATVVLAFARSAVAHPLNGTGFVVPRSEPALSITAATWISSKWPVRAPEGQVLMRGFIGGARAPRALDQSDDDLLASVHSDLSRLLGITANPSLARVYRWPRANPQLHVGHLDRVAEIDRQLETYRGLQIIGAAFRGVGIPDCVAAGRKAGRAVAERLRRP